jgi:hypothetical protein
MIVGVIAFSRVRNERRSIHHQKIFYIVTAMLPHQYSFIPICKSRSRPNSARTGESSERRRVVK